MALPIAAIICIVLACWVVVVLIIFALYQLLKTRGSCGCDCAPCGKEGGGGCSECCISVAESCNCCNPSVNGCLDSVCPGKKKISCVDIILCQCCANEGEESCCIKMFCCCCCCCDSDCDCCEDECCTCCADCDTLVCCCLEIRCRSNSEKTDAQAVKYETKSQQISCDCDGCEIERDRCPSCCQEQVEPAPEFQCPECPECTCHRLHCCYRCNDCFYGCCDCCYQRPDCSGCCSCCDCCDCCECECPFECNWTGPRCCEGCCEPPLEEEIREECCTCLPSLSCQPEGCTCWDSEEAERERMCLQGYEKTCDCCMWCYNWECVCRMCDPLLCDCCPKLFCSKSCMSYRPYPYCFDYCGICTLTVLACWKMGTSCTNFKNFCWDACHDVCLLWCNAFWTCSCKLCCIRFKGFERCVICHCERQGDGGCLPLMDACIECIVTPVRDDEQDDEAMPDNKPTETNLPYCTKFSWFCCELRRKRLAADSGMTALARDLSRIGYSMQFLDGSGSVVDTNVVNSAILAQPQSSEDVSRPLGYTDSYGGYVSFADNHRKHSQTRAGSHHSCHTVGSRMSSLMHNTPSRLTSSLASRALLRRFEESESILYNEHLQGTSSMLAGRDSVKRVIDFSDISSDESEQESRTKLKIFRERESQTMMKIQANEEQFETIDKKLKKLKDSPLDTSNLELYCRKLSEKTLYRTDSREGKTSRKVSFIDEQPLSDHDASNRHKRRPKSGQKSHTSEKSSSQTTKSRDKNNVAVAAVFESEVEKVVPDYQVPGTSGLGQSGQPSNTSIPSSITGPSDEEATPQESKTMGQTVNTTSVEFEDEKVRGSSDTRRKKKKKSKSGSEPAPTDYNNCSGVNKAQDHPSSVFLNVNETESRVQTRRKKKSKGPASKGPNQENVEGHGTQGGKKKTKRSDGSLHRPVTLPDIGSRPDWDKEREQHL